MRFLLLGALVSACADAASGAGELPEPDAERFAVAVYPVLLRDCAMSECHGAATRFFRVVGPGRTRLSEDTAPLDLATTEEIELSYDRARSMLNPPPDTASSLLLRKPLAVDAGGASHFGSDAYGRNVYLSQRDPGYVVIADWALSEPAEREP